MKPEFVKAQKKGSILLKNRFKTEKGEYRIILSRYNSDIYFFKYRDGVLLECQNVSTAKPKEENVDV